MITTDIDRYGDATTAYTCEDVRSGTAATGEYYSGYLTARPEKEQARTVKEYEFLDNDILIKIPARVYIENIRERTTFKIFRIRSPPNEMRKRK